MNGRPQEHGGFEGFDAMGPDSMGPDSMGPDSMGLGERSGQVPLHQPPNPADLRRVPPASPECARIRGLLRDYSDGDLEMPLAKSVEEHVHDCRVCAVELARCEHEVLRLRRAFLTLGAVEPTLPPDFAKRVVERLVETEGVDPDVAQTGAGRAASAGSGDAEPFRLWGRFGQRDGSGQRDFVRASPAGMLVAALFALFLLVLGVRVFAAGEQLPGDRNAAFVVVVQANDTFGERYKRLLPGDSLGDKQRLWVRRGGLARLDWHDPSPRLQPAATLDLEDGELRMHNGAPLLLDGRVVVETHRSVDIPMADGSVVALGKGEYVIAAELPSDMLEDEPWDMGEDPIAAMARRAHIEVEVREGQPAQILRGGGAATLVAAGQVATYGAGGPITVGPSGPVAVGSVEDERSSVPPVPQVAIAGHARLPNNLPSVGSVIVLGFASGNGAVYTPTTSGADGRFSVPLERELDGDFVIVNALPSAVRHDLGMVAPQALPVERQAGFVQLGRPVVFEPSQAVVGVVRDQLQQLRVGVRVVPCIVDELFGLVSRLEPSVLTNAAGAFRLERLPARLPPHQHLVLVMWDGNLEPTVVPVPERGGEAALASGIDFVVPTVRLVQIVGLPVNATVQVWEEVPGLPPGSAAVRRLVQTNWFGEVLWTAVGRGRLWLRSGMGANATVRELVLAESGVLPRYAPAGSAKPYHEQFLPMHALAETGVLVAESHRLRDFVVAPGENLVGSQALQVLDHAGRLVAGAEVFAVRHTGVRGLLGTRFLGFTGANGVLMLGAASPEDDVFVIAPDGATGFRERAADPANGAAVHLQLSRTGRVLLSSALQPAPTNPDRVVTIRFRRDAEELLPGMAPVAVRFATDATQWEVGGVPAGHYIAEIDGAEYPVFVPPGGFVVLQP